MFSMEDGNDCGKVVRKNCFDEDRKERIHEGDYVLLFELKKDNNVEGNEINNELEKDGNINEKNEVKRAFEARSNVLGLSDLNEVLPENQFTFEDIMNDHKLANAMGIQSNNIVSIRVAYITEISKDFKMKLFSLSNEDFVYKNDPETTWRIVRSTSAQTKPLIKQMETICEFCTKVTMNPALQQIILSTPSCNGDFLTKIARSSSIILSNPSTKSKPFL